MILAYSPVEKLLPLMGNSLFGLCEVAAECVAIVEAGTRPLKT